MSSIDPYKGVRDFYPEDQRIQNYIFAAMRRAVESFGYEEMNASILEPTELYTAKSSEEIVREQTFTFKDRGDRSVTLRPEMTPTVARMVAAKRRELGFPLRLYSIQNFFRYERPQRGRLREFWQLNADLFGVLGLEADVEAVMLAYRVMKELGAADSDFVIQIGSRQFLDAAYAASGIDAEKRPEVTRLLDAKDKLPNLAEKLDAVVGVEARMALEKALSDSGAFEYFSKLRDDLKMRGVENAVIDPNVARGFDYYTGLVFEVFDTDPANTRSLFGGGRYDNLIGQYGGESVPAVGFAMGDVIAKDFLETHDLLPALLPATKLYLAPATPEDRGAAYMLADSLRESGIKVALGMKHEKAGDHIKAAVKLGIRYFALYGQQEKESGMIKLKDLSSETEDSIHIDKLREELLP